MRSKADPSPKIETAAYTFDRVKHIEVKEEIPENLVAVANPANWGQMARARAFEQLFREMGDQQNFKVHCVVRQKEEEDAGKRKRHYVICHLTYMTE